MPDPAHLEKQLRGERIAGHLLLWGLLLFVLLYGLQPWRFFLPGKLHMPLLDLLADYWTLIYFWLHVTVGLGFMAYKMVRACNPVPLRKAGPDLLGNWTAAELKAMLDTVLRKTTRNRLIRPSLFVIRSGDPNAFSANSWFLNKDRMKNGIFLFSWLLHALSREELEAVLAHEVAHYTRYQNPLDRAPELLLPLAGLAWLLVGYGMLGGYEFVHKPYTLDKLGFLLVPLLFVAWLILSRGKNLQQRRNLEYMADYRAALSCSPLAVINALLKIGSRAEAQERVALEVQLFMEEHPQADLIAINKALQEALEHHAPDWKTSLTRCRNILKENQPRHKKRKKTGRNAQKNLKRIRDALKKQDPRTAIHWEKFDSHIKDNRLDEKELPALVKALREDPESPLFVLRIEKKEDAVPGLRMDHPALRDRILFIAEHCLQLQ